MLSTLRVQMLSLEDLIVRVFVKSRMLVFYNPGIFLNKLCMGLCLADLGTRHQVAFASDGLLKLQVLALTIFCQRATCLRTLAGVVR